MRDNLAHAGQPAPLTRELVAKLRKRDIAESAYKDSQFWKDLYALLDAVDAGQPAPSLLDERVRQFLTDLAGATEYKSHPLGYEDSLDRHWKEDADELLAALGHSPNTVKAQEPPPEGIQHPDWGYDHHGNWVCKSVPAADTGEVKRLREALEIVKHMPHCMHDLACKLSHSPIAEDATPGKPSVCPCYHCRLEAALASAAPQEGSKP